MARQQDAWGRISSAISAYGQAEFDHGCLAESNSTIPWAIKRIDETRTELVRAIRALNVVKPILIGDGSAPVAVDHEGNPVHALKTAAPIEPGSALAQHKPGCARWEASQDGMDRWYMVGCTCGAVPRPAVIPRDSSGHAIGHPKDCRINNGFDMTCDCGAESEHASDV